MPQYPTLPPKWLRSGGTFHFQPQSCQLNVTNIIQVVLEIEIINTSFIYKKFVYSSYKFFNGLNGKLSTSVTFFCLQNN